MPRLLCIVALAIGCLSCVAEARAQPRVLLVLANTHFHYREYKEPREELEKAGIKVEVAAAVRAVCIPHAGSGQGADGGLVMPHWSLTQVDSTRYRAVVFVGGWGAASYQYAFPGVHANPAYNTPPAVKLAVNKLINDMLAQGKHVTAICHGVSVLAWARVGNVSPLTGRTVAAYALGGPASKIGTKVYADGQLPTRWHIEANGGNMVPARSVGNATTAADDVIVQGQIITAENYDSARQFGRVLAQVLGGR